MLKVMVGREDLEESSEEDLIHLARQGSEVAVRLLIRRNNQHLFRVARAVLRDDAEAEDAVQETYVKAFTKLDGFRGASRFSTWLTRIALNECFSRRRRLRHTTDVAELDTAVSKDPEFGQLFPLSLMPLPPDSETARMEMRAVLEQATDELPEAFRLVFILRDVEGLSIEETAEQLDIRPETVKTRLHRARHMLRNNIEQRLAATFSDIFPFDGARCTNLADRVVERLRLG